MAAALPAVAGATPRGGRIAGWATDPEPAERTDKAALQAKRGPPSPSDANNALATKGSRSSVSRKSSGRTVFESCLKNPAKSKAPVPALNINVVTDSLRRDEERQRYKYTFKDPAVTSARYHRVLPDRGQNEKYCRPEVRQPQPESPPVRFSKLTLSKWFQAIDKDDSGTLNPKEIILALRNSEELRHLFVHLQDSSGSPDPLAFEALGDGALRLHHGEGEGPDLEGPRGSLTTSMFAPEGPAEGTLEGVRSLMHSRAGSECGFHRGDERFQEVEQVTQEQLRQRKSELMRLKNVLKELAHDHDGCMDFDEFVEFFRRTGFLLEYRTFVGQLLTATQLPEILNAQLPPTPCHDGAQVPRILTSSAMPSEAGDLEDAEAGDQRPWTTEATMRAASHPSTQQWPASTSSASTMGAASHGSSRKGTRADVWMEHGASLAKAVNRQKTGAQEHGASAAKPPSA